MIINLITESLRYLSYEIMYSINKPITKSIFFVDMYIIIIYIINLFDICTH